MRSVALIVVLIAAHFTSGQAQLGFATAANKNPSTNTAAAATNGILVTLSADASNPYSYIVSDPVSTTAVTDVYVTLVCAKGLVDIGPVFGTAPTSAAALLGSGAATSGWKADLLSASTTGQITSSTANPTTTIDQYIFAPGQTLRYTFDPTGSGTYMGLNIRDVTGNSIQGTPCNANNGATSGTSTKCATYLKATAIELGFEVLNKGNAIICVQTPAQWATGNSCDGETSKATTCPTATLVTTYTATAKCTNKIYHNACTDTCTAGTYAYTTDATAGCVDCYSALTTNGFCAKTVAPASSSSILRVVGMFVASIYFVLFA